MCDFVLFIKGIYVFMYVLFGWLNYLIDLLLLFVIIYVYFVNNNCIIGILKEMDVI